MGGVLPSRKPAQVQAPAPMPEPAQSTTAEREAAARRRARRGGARSLLGAGSGATDDGNQKTLGAG